MEHQVEDRQYEVSRKTVADHIREWLTPLLVVVIGYLLGDKMSSISRKIEMIETIQNTITQVRVEMDNLKKNDEKQDIKISEQEKFHADELYQAAERRIRQGGIR